MLSIRRRELVAVGLTLLPRWSRGQPANLPIIGAILVGAAPDTSYVWTHLVEDLRRRGYIAERTIHYVARAAEDPARLSVFAAELVKLSPQVIYANGDGAARAVADTSTSIPIVAMTDDHVGAGLTDSFSRPSRNITGISRLEADLDTKRLEILHELVPSADFILILRDPETTWKSRSNRLEQAAEQSGVKLFIRDIRTVGDVDGAIAQGKAAGVGAILVLGSPLLTTLKIDAQIRQTAMSYALPMAVQLSNGARRGNLASYGLNQDAVIHQIADMIDRILKGTSVKEIPIEQPTKFEFVINLKTAKALGLTVPQSLLTRADEVIE